MGGSDTTDSMTQGKTTITLLGQDHGMGFYSHFDSSMSADLETNMTISTVGYSMDELAELFHSFLYALYRSPLLDLSFLGRHQ